MSQEKNEMASGIGRYLVQRAPQLALVILGVLVITFVVSHVAPSNPAALWAGAHPTAAEVRRVTIELGLDKPLPEQFYIYVTQLLRGNFGVSFRTHNPVLSDISAALTATLELVITAFVLAVIAGTIVGVTAAYKRDRFADHAGRLGALFMVSMPSFWLAMILQLVFSQTLHLFPLAGRMSQTVSLEYPLRTITGFNLIDSLVTLNFHAFGDSLWHLVLPAIALAVYPFGLTVRMLRSMMIEVLQENYVRSARAWGLSNYLILFKYALKNAVSSTIVALGMAFAYALTGAFLVELVFAWPGIGTYTGLSILSLDYAPIMGAVFVVAIFYVLINLLIDIFQVYLDPRVTL
jgi:peptide/nickel transport system permease protein